MYMSLATFKKKSINSASTATKISGKRTVEKWIYQGPYGRKTSLPSYIYEESLKVGVNSGFSVTGPYRNIGAVGSNMRFSKSGTPYRGVYPKGWGGTFGRYPDGPDNVLLNIMPVKTGVAIQNTTVKPPVLSNKGMLERRFRWINSGQYPSYWVQPVYTGNQTDTASQGLYIHNKSAANDCHYDVNNAENYVNYYKTCGSSGCQTTPARGYTMAIQQANAPYTKTLHKPKDSSAYTLRIQRRCQDQLPFQKPYPYAVQTGTGVLRGGINVNNVANACNTSNTTITPPDWYTHLDKLTIEQQLDTLRKKVLPELQAQVFDDLFLKGTSNV
jgi:hypothetical protein